MGDGDPMKGMVRMMEMMGSMNGMMGSGVMGPSTPNDQTPRCGEDRELHGRKDGDGNDGETLPDLRQGSDRPHVQALRRVDLLGNPRRRVREGGAGPEAAHDGAGAPGRGAAPKADVLRMNRARRPPAWSRSRGSPFE